MFFEYLKYLSWKGKLQLILGSIAYKLFTAIPKGVFEVRNFVEASQKKGYKIDEEALAYVVSKDRIKILLRKGSSDLKVFRQIIINEEFKNVVQLIHQHDIKIKNVIDAGANIGLTTLYLKEHFPETEILCIEPDASNQAQLSQHIALNNLTKVELIKGGVWSHNSWLNIDNTFRDGLEWSRRLKPSETERGNIPVYSINHMLADKQWDSIDLLKMDIEGAEETIFSESSDLSFLNKTKVITIEVHNMLEVGHRIVEVLQEYNYKLYFSGELTIGIKK